LGRRPADGPGAPDPVSEIEIKRRVSFLSLFFSFLSDCRGSKQFMLTASNSSMISMAQRLRCASIIAKIQWNILEMAAGSVVNLDGPGRVGGDRLEARDECVVGFDGEFDRRDVGVFHSHRHQ